MGKKSGKSEPAKVDQVYVLGLDANGKPRGARFVELKDNIASAAIDMNCRVLIDQPEAVSALGMKLFARAVDVAGLDLRDGNVTPHTLRHTAATWLMQRSVEPWEAAGFLGMSVQVLIDTYGHHHPNHLRGAADAITRKPRTPSVLRSPPADRSRTG
jgi:hypothetical protein